MALPALALSALSGLSAALVSLGMKLVTETFLKRVILLGLQAVADRTESQVDNQLVSAVREAWGTDE